MNKKSTIVEFVFSQNGLAVLTSFSGLSDYFLFGVELALRPAFLNIEFPTISSNEEYLYKSLLLFFFGCGIVDNWAFFPLKQGVCNLFMACSNQAGYQRIAPFEQSYEQLK